MTTNYEALYADHQEQRDHWWWRPGWEPGTRFLTFHITLDGQSALHDLMDDYAVELVGIPTLDRVPRQWRHITLQGLGHTSEFSQSDIDQVCAAVAGRLAGATELTAKFQRAVILREAVAVAPETPESFTQVRNAVRAAISDALGDVSESEEGFRAHATLAYANGVARGSDIRAALDNVSGTATATFRHVDLIEMHRDHRMYEWQIRASIPIGGPPDSVGRAG